ncbi:MAG: hypothetical protein ACRESZ_07535 [Methylococcales bacterium]
MGGKQKPGDKNNPGIVEPYCHPDRHSGLTEDCRLTIPANSLRGMISNVTEIISQSALRALAKEKDTVYLTSDEDLGDFQSRIDCSALRFNGIFSEAEARFRVDSDETLQLALSNAK